MCLGVTCHLHFWQNDRDILRATAATFGACGLMTRVFDLVFEDLWFEDLVFEDFSV